VRQAQDELAAMGARPRKLLLSGVESLMPSERQVARMAAQGMANKELAQALFVTVKAVEVHVSSVYRKLRISSRAQLAQALAGAADLADQAPVPDGRGPKPGGGETATPGARQLPHDPTGKAAMPQVHLPLTTWKCLRQTPGPSRLPSRRTVCGRRLRTPLNSARNLIQTARHSGEGGVGAQIRRLCIPSHPLAVPIGGSARSRRELD
jgi:DNA-binding CsgD family transcriptional regulator